MRPEAERPTDTPSWALPPGQRLGPLRRFGLPHYARRRPDPSAFEPARIQVGGDVRYPVAVPWAELVARVGRHRQRCDLHCVTTWSVQGLSWGGPPFAAVLQELMRRAEPTADAAWLTVTGLDGFRACLAVQDARAEGVLLADELDSAPIPVDHGAPLRLVAPAHYGYKNVKHVCSIDFHARYQPGSAGWAEHPRARVDREERSQGLPGPAYRRIYRGLLPLARRPYRRHT